MSFAFPNVQHFKFIYFIIFFFNIYCFWQRRHSRISHKMKIHEYVSPMYTYLYEYNLWASNFVAAFLTFSKKETFSFQLRDEHKEKNKRIIKKKSKTNTTNICAVAEHEYMNKWNTAVCGRYVVASSRSADVCVYFHRWPLSSTMRSGTNTINAANWLLFGADTVCVCENAEGIETYVIVCIFSIRCEHCWQRQAHIFLIRPWCSNVRFEFARIHASSRAHPHKNAIKTL